jgi:hypothetical protein
MKTIGRHFPQTGRRGDFECMCDYCGVYWYRSQLRLDAAGFLACPDDQKGRDVVTLARENASSASAMPLIRGRIKRR